MRLLLVIITCSVFLFGTTGYAHEILVVQSFRATPYDEALLGFREVCNADVKTVKVSDRDSQDIAKVIRDERPSIILAIGASALREVSQAKNVPIIYLMVLNPDDAIKGRQNVTGVRMLIPPEKFLNIMEKLDMPKLKVGLLYNPANSGELVKRIHSGAKSRGIEIRTKEVARPQEVPEALSKLSGSINLFWLIPDPAVVTGDTIEFLLLYTQQKKIPVVTFAGKYVDMGALLSLNIDCLDMGRQAGDIANRILRGAKADAIPPVEARNAILKTNRKVAAKLGVDLTPLDSFIPSLSRADER